MQTSGTLVMRLASHAMAACSTAAPLGAGVAQTAQWRTVAATTVAGEAASLPSLSEWQRQQLPRLLSALQRPGAAAQRLGALASLSASYRDLSLLLSALSARTADRDPLLDDPRVNASRAAAASELEQLGNLGGGGDGPSPAPAAAQGAGTGSSASTAKPGRGAYLPLRDVTLLPEELQVDGRSEAPDEPRLSQQHMDKVSCWAATQPGHIEMSHQLMTGIKLFPPTEAAYPTYVDFDAAMRLLAHHRSRKRMRFQRRLARTQDRYQIKAWQHVTGEG